MKNGMKLLAIGAALVGAAAGIAAYRKYRDFYEELPDGEYAGKSKGRKQFNSSCYIHRE